MDPSKIKEMMDALPPEMRKQFAGQQAGMQNGMLKYLANLSKGESKYLERRFGTTAELSAFLNTNRLKVLSWQVVPDFNSLAYILIYEETNG